MVWTVTPTQQAALLDNHNMSTKVSVVRGGTSLGDIPVVSASITATYNTQGGRDGSIVVDKELIDSGLLNPLSDQVYIRTGISGVVDIPIFTGRVDSQVLEMPDGKVEVPLLSRSAEAIRAAFETPWAATDGNQARMEMAKILQNVNPAWTVDYSHARDVLIPSGLVWEDDLGQAMDQLARGASLIWQPDRTGGFTIYTNPYFIGVSAPSTGIVFRDGENGVTVNVQAAKSREGIYNSVTVVAERYGNQVPVRVTVRDNNSASPTYWGGVFGKQNLVVKSQLPIDVNGCEELATRVLRQSLSLQRSWTITLPHFPLLDPGDVFALWFDGEITTQVAESVQYAGSAQDSTVINSRELRQISAEVIAS